MADGKYIPAPSSEDQAQLNSRQLEIVDIVSSQGFATIETLAQRFNVSAQTIRRDIILMDELRVLQRFHGGAGVADGSVRLGYARKLTTQEDSKTRIGREVAKLVAPGATLFLDVGTTVEAVARNLNVQPVRVFTNCMPVANILAEQPGIETCVLGGVVRGADGSLVGDMAIETISRFKVEMAVIGCSGFDDDGMPMDFDLMKVAVKHAMASRAERVVLVTDATKFQRQAVVRLDRLGKGVTLITDGPPEARLAEMLGECGIAVVVAE